jgi:hypothetical protein
VQLYLNRGDRCGNQRVIQGMQVTKYFRQSLIFWTTGQPDDGECREGQSSRVKTIQSLPLYSLAQFRPR